MSQRHPLGQGDMAEYVAGIEASSSEWLFLTEPHCEVQSEIVGRIQNFFRTNEAAGFCCHCQDRFATAWGKMEGLLYSESIADWKRPGNWQKMIMRGFGIRRSAYEGAGGFRLRYGRFSEWLLAADLHRRGYYLDYAADVSVIHHYTPDKKYLDEAIEEFSIGQAQYLAEAPADERLPYFQGPGFAPPADERVADLMEKAVKQGELWQWPRKLHEATFSPRNELLLRRELNAIAVQLLAPLHADAAIPFFKRYYESQSQLCLRRHYPPAPNGPMPLTPGDCWSAADNALTSVTGTFQTEQWQGISFAWAKPVFALSVKPSGAPLVLELQVPHIARFKYHAISLVTELAPEKRVPPQQQQDRTAPINNPAIRAA